MHSLRLALFSLCVVCAEAGTEEFFPKAGELVAVPLVIELGVEPAAEVPTYRVIDYSGRTKAEGKAEPDGTGGWVARFVPGAGFYEVIAAGQNEAQATGLWCTPAEEALNDGFMAIDTAMSWLTKPEDRPELIGNLRRVLGAGGMARERLSWTAINPSNGRWEWDTDRRYDATRRLYAEAGIPVLEMFHDSPAWMGRAQGGRFPDDLPEVASGWSEVARRWSGLWGALEVWNEPDIGFGGHQPADQYVPLVKTIRRAMSDVGAAAPLGAGVFAAFNPAYLELAARNGLLDECDFISFHYYGNPLGIEGLIGQYRAWMATAGHETKPLWMTEVGRPRGGRSGVRPPSGEQARTALTYAMQAVEAKACGVVRFFPFVYIEYSEGQNHHGMLDKRRTPLRALAASSHAGRELTGLNYVGDVPAARVSGAARVRVFARDTGGEALAVVYTGKVEAEATVTLPFATTAARGVDGRKLETTDGGRRVPVPDGLTYVSMDRALLGEVLDSGTEAMRLWTLGRSAHQSLPATAGIVLQPQIDRGETRAISVRGYFLKPGAKAVMVRVGVNNLSDEMRMVTVHTGEPGGRTVKVAAHSREFLTMDVTLDGLPTGFAGDDLRVEITATADDSSRIAPVALIVIPDEGEGGVAEHLAASAYQFALSVGEAYRWDDNTSGKLTFGHEPPAAWGYTVRFPAGVDRWAYPRFSLPQEVDHKRVTGVLVRARCLRPGTVRLMSWDDRGEMSVTHFPILPADGEWHTTYVPLASYRRTFAISRPITKISVGFNSKEDVNTLEISDLYMIGK